MERKKWISSFPLLLLQPPSFLPAPKYRKGRLKGAGIAGEETHSYGTGEWTEVIHAGNGHGSESPELQLKSSGKREEERKEARVEEKWAFLGF